MPSSEVSIEELEDSVLINAILSESKVETKKKEKEKEISQPIPELKLKEDEVLYSSLFGKSHSTRDHAVKVFKKEDWPEELQAFIPTRNKNYVFQKEATENVVLGIQFGDNILISGPTGSGKSTLIKEVCAMLNRPFIRINMTGDMESSAFFGQYVVHNGATVWKDGPMTEGAKLGAVVLVDEWELSPPEITMGLQYLLEDEGRLFLKEKAGDSHEKLIVPHKEFRIICGGNTVGQGDESGAHAGTNVQNTATIDRFQTVLELDYLSKTHEFKILRNSVADLDVASAKRMLQFASLLRNAYKHSDVSLTMSPRTLINWARKTVYWGDPVHALKVAFFDKLPANEKPVVRGIIEKVFGEVIK